jgi:type IV secretory pathway VirB4 component
LAVISGRSSEVKRMETIIDLVGANPEAWLPRFLSSHVH